MQMHTLVSNKDLEVDKASQILILESGKGNY